MLLLAAPPCTSIIQSLSTPCRPLAHRPAPLHTHTPMLGSLQARSSCTSLWKSARWAGDASAWGCARGQHEWGGVCGEAWGHRHQAAAVAWPGPRGLTHRQHLDRHGRAAESQRLVDAPKPSRAQQPQRAVGAPANLQLCGGGRGGGWGGGGEERVWCSGESHIGPRPFSPPTVGRNLPVTQQLAARAGHRPRG